MNNPHPFWHRTTKWGYRNPAYDKFQRIMAYSSMVLLAVIIVLIIMNVFK